MKPFSILFFLLIVTFSTSCSSLETFKTKIGPWEDITVDISLMKWHWCSEVLDPPESKDLYDKGWCFVVRQQRWVNRPWPRSDYHEYRQRQEFCAFADVECMRRNRFMEMEVKR